MSGCSELDGSSAYKYFFAITVVTIIAVTFYLTFFLNSFFTIFLWGQDILFFPFHKEKLGHGEIKGQIVQKQLGTERFTWALNIIFRRTSTPYS